MPAEIGNCVRNGKIFSPRREYREDACTASVAGALFRRDRAIVFRRPVQREFANFADPFTIGVTYRRCERNFATFNRYRTDVSLRSDSKSTRNYLPKRINEQLMRSDARKSCPRNASSGSHLALSEMCDLSGSHGAEIRSNSRNSGETPRSRFTSLREQRAT